MSLSTEHLQQFSTVANDYEVLTLKASENLVYTFYRPPNVTLNFFLTSLSLSWNIEMKICCA